VLTEDRAAAIKTAEAALQIPGDCNPEVYDEGSWPRVDAWVSQLGLADPSALCRHPRCPARVMAWPAAGCGVVAAGGLRGEEDEQAQ
jgi:hypothetical protein